MVDTLPRPSSIGRMYNAGDLPGGKDYNKAVEWYDLSLSRGDAWGGANAAWVIAEQTPAGYTIYDAVVRAAKATALGNPAPSESAAKLLARLGKEPIAGGTQLLMKELGVDIEVDGAFGGGSLKKLNAFGAENGVKFSKTPTKRLEQLAKIFWERSKFRVDLY